MPRVLLLCASYPVDLSSGADLRFWNLCREIAARNESFLVCFGDVPAGIDPSKHIGVLDCRTLPIMPREGLSFLRHLRLTNTHFIERSAPEYLRGVRTTLDSLTASWKIDAIVCMVPHAAEILMSIDSPKLLDYCDSRTLTYRRMLGNRGRDLTLTQRLAIYLKYIRQRPSERKFVRHFDRTTTISRADRDSLLEVSGVIPERVVVIPNGVSSDALAHTPSAGARERSVVFWGNLDFPPNWAAVDYFNREIFLPFLADREIEWHIIGKGADDAIRNLARHPRVTLHGFVDDLFSEIASHGVMVNPMVEGSGLKNKVLEAFACGVPVVSTQMGIEAVGARAGIHYLAGDNPRQFADAVFRCLDDAVFALTLARNARQFVEEEFRWTVIGDRLQQLIQEIAQ